MVTGRGGIWRDTRGRSKLGCLFTLLIAATIAYFGVNVGTVYLRYWRLQDEMKTQARLAPSLDDEAIRRRLLRKVEQLNLPAEAQRITIRRLTRPREIRIRTTYRDTLELPFYRYLITLTPQARQPL